jgi:hypothetical protein
MKTIKKTVAIEIPSSVDAVIGGLDELRSLHPTLIAAERELVDATAQLATTRDDLQRQHDEVERLAIGADAVAHAAAFHRWQANKVRVAPVEARVKRAEVALREARYTAAAAAVDEGRRRHDVILKAAMVLVDELRQLQQFEDGLNRRLAEMPQVAAGAGMNSVGGTIRDVAVVTAQMV